MVVGVSGGADSVCLLHVLSRWQAKLGIKLYIAHLNHQLRGSESEVDAMYVSNLAESLGIPISIVKRDVATYKTRGNCSIEEAARELRYGFFSDVANNIGAARIAVGHTRDDQVETILMHILRGTGTLGLRGLEPCSSIPVKSQQSSVSHQLLVIRPLLDITREETTDYCQEHQLEPRVDSSNLSLSFFRNRLRLELLPLLRQYNPGFDQALLRLSDIAKEDSAFIKRQALALWDKVAKQENNAIYLDKKQIVDLPTALQRQLLRLSIAKLTGDVRDIEAIHLKAIRALLNKPVGKKVSLPHGIICEGRYNELVITKLPFGIASFPSVFISGTKQSGIPSLPCPFPPLQSEFSLKVPGETVLPGWKVIASIVNGQATTLSSQGISFPSPLQSVLSVDTGICRSNLVAEFDLDKTGTKLFIRNRQPGDRFQPLGMNMLKRLGRFMVDVKIPFSWRAQIPIVCSAKQIIWVVSYRIDDRVKITKATSAVLCIEFVRST